MAEYKTFQKKRRNSPKKTICVICTIVTHSVLLCYTAIGHFRWVRWDPKWPWAPWQWVAMTFQAFRGPSGAQIAFMILLAALPCFEKLKPYLGGLAIFHTPSHTEDVWKIAKPPKNGFSFSKQGSSENNIFSRFWIFFSWVYPEKFSIDFLP